MSNYDRDAAAPAFSANGTTAIDVGLRAFMLRVYNYMAVPVGNSILLATDIESGDAPALCERSVA